jgi:hypothetical protein
MNPDELYQGFIASLQAVRAKLEAGDDDWEFVLLDTYIAFSKGLEIHPDLLAPLEKLRHTTWEKIRRARDAKAGKRGAPPVPADRALPMLSAAAAVTVLSQRRGDMGEVIAEVSQATGVDQKDLRIFRGNLVRATASDDNVKAYHRYVSEMKNWLKLCTRGEFIENLKRLQIFVK